MSLEGRGIDSTAQAFLPPQCWTVSRIQKDLGSQNWQGLSGKLGMSKGREALIDQSKSSAKAVTSTF